MYSLLKAFLVLIKPEIIVK